MNVNLVIIIHLISMNKVLCVDSSISNSIDWKPLEVTCNVTSTNINHVNNVNICYVTSSLSILNVNEKIDLMNTDRTKIDGFLVRNKNMYWMPIFDDKVASNLRVLHVERSQLKGITQENLKLMTNLKSLDLTGNHIGKLENKPFECNIKLFFINLTENRITFIELGTFDHLQQLERLYLHDNICHSSGSNAKTREKVKKMIKVINSSCGSNNFKTSTTGKKSSPRWYFPTESTNYKRKSITSQPTTQSYSKSSTTLSHLSLSTSSDPTSDYLNFTTSTQLRTSTTTKNSNNQPSITSSTIKPDEKISNPQSYIIVILLSTILLVLIVILICVVYNNIASLKYNKNTFSVQQQSEEYEQISSMNNYSTLERIKSENQGQGNENEIQLDQRTSGIYEEIICVHETQDDTYNNPLDDIAEEDSDGDDDISTKLQNQDDYYESVNDEVYQEINCEDFEAQGTVEVVDYTYNEPHDFYDQTLSESLHDNCDYELVNQLQIHEQDLVINQQNTSASSIEFSGSESCGVSEDLYAETIADRQQEVMHDIYATVQKN